MSWRWKFLCEGSGFGRVLVVMTLKPSSSSGPGPGAVASRPVLRAAVVRRLLAVDESGGVTRVHVRIAAEAVGVSERTMWRWLAQGREGQIAGTPRGGAGFFLDEEAWQRLGSLGGNVSALYRWMTSDRPDRPASDQGPVPSLATVMRVVRRDLRAGRALEVARPARGHVDPGYYDRALAELALPDMNGEAAPLHDVPGPAQSAEINTAATGGGARLYAPGARLVSTQQLSAVVEAVAHTVAARGLICVYGDTGYGKTLAVEQALRLLPRRMPVCRALVAVKPALPQLRAALLTAFGLSAPSLTNRTDAADRALLDALKDPAVLLIDDVQRIAAPELDYLRLLMDAPSTQTSLVLCGAGAERTLARAPALASRVLTWHHTPRLDSSQVSGVLRLFHPLWGVTADEDLLHADETCARGNFRTWAKITSHLYAVLDRRPETLVDRALLSWACSRLGPNP